MTVEVVAVRWECFSCDRTAVTAPGELPSGWFELGAPPWRAGQPARHYCEDCAEVGRKLGRRRAARYSGEPFAVSRSEFESVRAELRKALHRLDQLRLNGERAASREIV